MVSFYANVILKIQAWRLGHLLCLIIGRRERGARRCRWQGSPAFFCHNPERERIFQRILFSVIFHQGPRHSHLYAERGAH